MNHKFMDALKIGALGVLGGLAVGCGGGSPSDSSSFGGHSSSIINLSAVGQPLPDGVIAFEELASDISKLHFTDNELSGHTVLWEKVDSSGGLQSPISLHVSDYDPLGGWTTAKNIKSGLSVSEVELSRDSLGDVHTSWFSPGVGIFARSRVNGVWQAESLLTVTGACLDMDSQNIGVGTQMVWCETGDLIGFGENSASGWINTGVLDAVNGETISGQEPSLELLNNGDFLTTWVTTEVPNGDLIAVNALYIGKYTSGEKNLSKDLLATMDVSVSSVNDVFTNGSDRHLVVWTDNSNSPNALNVSVFDGFWSLPVVLNTAVDGYTDFEAHFLDNGDIILLAERFGRNMSIYYYSGSTWKTVDSINNVSSFDAVVLGNELLLVYSADLETKGVRISSGLITSIAFELPPLISDIGIARLDTDKLLIVWRSVTTAFYAALKI